MSINDQPSVTPRQSSSIDNHLSDDAKKTTAAILTEVLLPSSVLV